MATLFFPNPLYASLYPLPLGVRYLYLGFFTVKTAEAENKLSRNLGLFPDYC